MASRGQPDALTLAANSCASVKEDCVAPANLASPVGASWIKPGGGDEVSAWDSGTLGDCIR